MKFEDFIPAGGSEDIFGKTAKLGGFLDSGEPSGCEGLGVRLLTPARPDAVLQETCGTEHPVIMLGSNSYLNLTTHPQVVEGARRALDKFGYGMGAVSLFAGITDLHRELERAIARFHGTEDAILFSSGYGTNIGVVSALCGPGDVIINDSANHASILDGSRLSGATLKVFPHGNMKALEQTLERIPDTVRGRLIITDGVFSMHGDIARLDEIVRLAEAYGARVMVDDAHGLGVVGPTGRGTAEVYGVGGKVDLHVGMLSKAPGAVGGYCAASADIVRYLRLYARTYFFSTALPAPVVGGLIEVFQLLENDAAGRSQLWENIRYMKDRLVERGFRLGDSQSGILPVIVGDEGLLFAWYEDLRRAGVYTNIVTYPAVRRKECRLRLCMMKDLSREKMDQAVEIMVATGSRHGII